MLIPFGVLSAAGAGLGFESDYELIATEILTTTESSITFSNLGDYSSTYKHLQLRMVSKMVANADRYLTINGSAMTRQHNLAGQGSVVQSGTETAFGYIDTGGATGWRVHVIDFLDAYSTSKTKTVRSFTGTTEGSTRVELVSLLQNSTTATTSFAINLTTSSFIAGSRFSLYGIK